MYHLSARAGMDEVAGCFNVGGGSLRENGLGTQPPPAGLFLLGMPDCALQRLGAAMTTNDGEAVLVDVTQAAAMLGLHRASVYKLTASGKFPKPIKLGRATRWVKDELTAWIAAKCPPLAKWEAMNAAPAKKIGKRG